jgi:ABC-type uncharacterized transport system permease subunit
LINVESLVLNSLNEATPLMLAALGEMLVERSGKVNLGVEGMMAIGAAAGALAGVKWSSLLLSFIIGGIAGALLSIVYLIFVIILNADQIVTGLILVFMGIGLSELIGIRTGGAPGTPLLTTIGPFDPIELIAIFFGILMWVILYKTWFGVELRAIGEDEVFARERGLRVDLIRSITIVAGGFLAGIAGTYLSDSFHYGRWYSGITEGMGWIAIGDVILGYWHPIGVLLSSYFTGFLFAIKPLLPTIGIPSELADAAPYLAVLTALIIVTFVYKRLGITPPASVWKTG